MTKLYSIKMNFGSKVCSALSYWRYVLEFKRTIGLDGWGFELKVRFNFLFGFYRGLKSVNLEVPLEFILPCCKVLLKIRYIYTGLTT